MLLDLAWLLFIGSAFLILQWSIRLWKQQQFHFSDKTVLITGGSRGLGLVLARKLVQKGARIAICARDAAELELVRDEFEQLGQPILTILCDVTDQEQVNQLIDAAEQQLGSIDVLINNAGIIQVAPLELMTIAEYREAINTHFWAPLYTTLAVLPIMKRSGGGRIINIASIGGKISVPHLTPYCASKHALVGLSEGMRTELTKDNIFITTVCPGVIRTGSTEHSIFKGQNRKEYSWFTLGASTPVISMSTDAVAKRIIAASQRGDVEVLLSLPTQVMSRLYGLFPGSTTRLFSWIAPLLPKAGGVGTERRTGAESHSAFAPSIATTLNDREMVKNKNRTTANEGREQQIER